MVRLLFRSLLLLGLISTVCAFFPLSAETKTNKVFTEKPHAGITVSLSVEQFSQFTYQLTVVASSDLPTSLHELSISTNTATAIDLGPPVWQGTLTNVDQNILHINIEFFDQPSHITATLSTSPDGNVFSASSIWTSPEFQIVEQGTAVKSRSMNTRTVVPSNSNNGLHIITIGEQ